MLNPELFIIFLACVAGCGYSSYKLGHQKGIEAALDFLHSTGRIDLEKDDLFHE